MALDVTFDFTMGIGFVKWRNGNENGKFKHTNIDGFEKLLLLWADTQFSYSFPQHKHCYRFHSHFSFSYPQTKHILKFSTLHRRWWSVFWLHFSQCWTPSTAGESLPTGVDGQCCVKRICFSFFFILASHWSHNVCGSTSTLTTIFNFRLQCWTQY